MWRKLGPNRRPLRLIFFSTMPADEARRRLELSCFLSDASSTLQQSTQRDRPSGPCRSRARRVEQIASCYRRWTLTDHAAPLKAAPVSASRENSRMDVEGDGDALEMIVTTGSAAMITQHVDTEGQCAPHRTNRSDYCSPPIVQGNLCCMC